LNQDALKQVIYQLPTEVKKLILKTLWQPGDDIMLTAAIRDLHKCYPGKFITDIRSPHPQLWENNPYISILDENDPEVEMVECDCPIIHKCNELPFHFIHGFIDFLNRRLDLKITPTAFKGDIYLSNQEKDPCLRIPEFQDKTFPFWIVVAGGKSDFTIKWWDTKRFQQVIDHFLGKILFLQVGRTEDYHPPLKNVVDLRGKTDLRQLIQLVYHSGGVISPVTLLMHLAAAIECKGNANRHRPCVVVAGGREPPHWEAYSSHQFIHTVGALPCCANGGCWRSRTLPLNDGSPLDDPENLCKNVIANLPYCMDMITSQMVIQRVEQYFDGNMAAYLNGDQESDAAKTFQFTEARTATDDGSLEVLEDVDRGRLKNATPSAVTQFSPHSKSPLELIAADELIHGIFAYGRIGHAGKRLVFLANGKIGEGAASGEAYWDVKPEGEKINLYIASETKTVCVFQRLKKNIWIGQWFRFSRMPMKLTYLLNA
jgi:hypothetical protein